MLNPPVLPKQDAAGPSISSSIRICRYFLYLVGFFLETTRVETSSFSTGHHQALLDLDLSNVSCQARQDGTRTQGGIDWRSLNVGAIRTFLDFFSTTRDVLGHVARRASSVDHPTGRHDDHDMHLCIPRLTT